MRKFFSFQSSSNNANDSSKPPPVRKACSANPGPSDSRDSSINSCGTSSNLDPKQKTTIGPFLRRSLSLSSAPFSRRLEDECLDSMSGSSSSCCHEASHHSSCHDCIRDSSSKPRKWDPTRVETEHQFLRTPINSPRSSSGRHCSSGVPHRCDSISSEGKHTRNSEITDRNDILDLYTDREHQESRHNGRLNHHSSLSAFEHTGKKSITHFGRPPRALSTAPTSPASSKSNLRSRSFSLVRDIHKSIPVRDMEANDLASPYDFTEKITGRDITKLPDYDSDATNKTEDIHEDSSVSQSSARFIPQQFVHHSYENLGSSGIDHERVTKNGSPFGYISVKHLSKSLPSSESEAFDGADEDLLTELKDAEERVKLLTFVDKDHEKLQNASVSTFMQLVKNLNRERRNLALKVLGQVQCRISEKAQTKNTRKNEIKQLNSIVKRAEDDKNEIQTNLEKELDRRSSEWEKKLQSFQAEERRLRERARELAEENVLLQKEVSLLRCEEVQSREQVMKLETELNDLTTKLEEIEGENRNLCQTIAELKQSSSSAEADRDNMRVNFKDKEKENKELEAIVLRLQKNCKEQDQTISGLRNQLSGEVGEQSMERGDQINRMRMEQLRLTGVERSLRKELELCTLAIQSTKHENVSLLEHIEKTNNGHGISQLRLDQELHSQVSFLQNLGVSVLAEISDLCGKLLDHVKIKLQEQSQDGVREINEDVITEFFLKFQKLKGKIENMKRSLNNITEIMAEKPHSNRSEHRSSEVELQPRQQKSAKAEEDVEYDLKMETLVTRVLKEKLFCKDLELQQRCEENSTMVREREVLRSDTARLHNELSNMIQKANENEFQMQRKDEKLKQLRQECEGLLMELAVVRNTLAKLSGERDGLLEELKLSKENSMLLNYEVDSLKRRIEALDEDVLFKEGQITILKDGLGINSFEAITCRKSLS